MAAEPARPEPVLHNGRGHNSERPVYRKTKTKTHSNLTASVSGYTLKGILIKLKRKILTVFSNTIVGSSLVFLLLLCVLRDKTNE